MLTVICRPVTHVERDQLGRVSGTHALSVAPPRFNRDGSRTRRGSEWHAWSDLATAEPLLEALAVLFVASRF